MGNHPGPSIVDIIDVDLPRPRDRVAILDDPAFRHLQDQLLRRLKTRTSGMSVMPAGSSRQIVVVGNGMVGHRFVEAAMGSQLSPTNHASRGHRRRTDPRLRPSRGLSSFFDDASADDLCLVEPGAYESAGVSLLLGERVVEIDRGTRSVTTDRGPACSPTTSWCSRTGSFPFVPPVDGGDRARECSSTALSKISCSSATTSTPVTATSVQSLSGGLLGLEAANTLCASWVLPRMSSKRRPPHGRPAR